VPSDCALRPHAYKYDNILSAHDITNLFPVA